MTEQRADKVWHAIDGASFLGDLADSFAFGLINPWSEVASFDPSVTAQIAAQGGATLVLHVGAGPLGATLGNVTGSFRIALMWDDEKPAKVTTTQEGVDLVVQIGPPLGERLSVWADEAIPVQAGSILPFDAAPALEKESKGNQAAPNIADAAKNLLGDVGTKLLGFEQSTIQTVIVVGGLIVLGYLLFAGPINRLAAKAGGAA